MKSNREILRTKYKRYNFYSLANDSSLPKSPLFAQDETNFYLKVIDARIEFEKDADGNVTGLISHYLGQDEAGKKSKVGRPALQKKPGTSTEAEIQK